MRNALREAARGFGLEQRRQICPFDRRHIVSMIDSGFGYGYIRRELGCSVSDIDLTLRQIGDSENS